MSILTEVRYTKLVTDIRKLIEEGKARADLAARQELVQTYWSIGKRITEEGLTHNAGYNTAVLEDVAEELNIDLATLKRCISFFKTYKGAPSGTNLSWSHYRNLLPITNDEERERYEDLAEEDGLNVAQLSKTIIDGRYGQSQKSNGKTVTSEKVKRPTESPYIYKAIVDRGLARVL